MKLVDISTPKFPNTYAMVDDADFDLVSQWKWCPEQGSTTIYVCRSINAGGRRVRVAMHRFLLGPEGKLQVDHIDGNGLNNQRGNLRICTATQNRRNRHKVLSTTSKYMGVYRGKGRNKYVAEIVAGKKRLCLGYFASEIEAAKARDAAAIQLHGEFASLNFPELRAASLGHGSAP